MVIFIPIPEPEISPTSTPVETSVEEGFPKLAHCPIVKDRQKFHCTLEVAILDTKYTSILVRHCSATTPLEARQTCQTEGQSSPSVRFRPPWHTTECHRRPNTAVGSFPTSWTSSRRSARGHHYRRSVSGLPSIRSRESPKGLQ